MVEEATVADDQKVQVPTRRREKPRASRVGHQPRVEDL